jgi:hypothetical protein
MKLAVLGSGVTRPDGVVRRNTWEHCCAPPLAVEVSVPFEQLPVLQQQRSARAGGLANINCGNGMPLSLVKSAVI